MKIVLDTHTHTLASGHAYSTLSEMITTASDKGLELLAITEHAPSMPGTCARIYFSNLNVVRRQVGDLELMMGTELNILDFDGNIDLPCEILDKLDLSIASLHTPCIKPGTKLENTSAYLNVMKNPYVNIIGHPDDSRYPLDYEALIQAASDYKVIIELNNSSLNPNGFRVNSKDNDITVLNLCKKYKVPISLGSDAHIKDDIANYCFCKDVLKETDFPEELILNTNVKKFKDFLLLHKQIVLN